MASRGSQWESVQSHSAVNELYDQVKDPSGALYFPIELRHYFAPFLEDQPWHMINPDDRAHAANARMYTDLLFKKIAEKINSLALSPNQDAYILKIRLEEIAVALEAKYASDPLELVRVILYVLGHEREILETGGTKTKFAMHSSSFSSTSYGMDVSKLNDASLNAEIQKLQEHTAETEAALAQLLQDQEYLVIWHQDWDELNARAQAASGAQAKALAAECHTLRGNIMQAQEGILRTRREILEAHVGAITHSEQVLSILLAKLKQWKAVQRKQTMDESFLNDVLNHMQLQFESLADVYWNIRHQLRQHEVQREQLDCGDENESAVFDQLSTQLHAQLETLLRASFVIVEQPPQVMKTSTKFSSAARILVGGKLNMHLSPPEVNLQLVNEPQATALVNDDELIGNSGDLLNGKQMMAYSESTRTLQATFKNLSLKKIRRHSARKEVVTEEKLALIFVTSVQLGDLTYNLWTMSVPVVVIVHNNQLVRATATVFWDNSFGKTDRALWEVPDAVRWPKFAAGLNHFFTLANGRPLTPDALNFLGSKLLEPGEDTVEWRTFSKDNLRNRSFTFWEWFYAIVELVRKHLAGPWIDGLVVGFVSKSAASEALMHQPRGTFLMRFSDSELGGVSVSWNVVDGATGTSKVYNLQPWFEKDLAIRSLPDCIKDLDQLRILYPGTPKDDAFAKYYSEEKVVVGDGDYVRATINAAIIGDEDATGTLDSIATSSTLSTMDFNTGSLEYDSLAAITGFPMSSYMGVGLDRPRRRRSLGRRRLGPHGRHQPAPSAPGPRRRGLQLLRRARGHHLSLDDRHRGSGDHG
ncbi:Stat5.1 [Thecamonas trahens ATCC 50062]|uniref:Signal transducer and activator of transcription n=1 Tax=Thecamonas trahens ATCC 50062 TaxID=461836 RepID=A0A0L0D4K5_THETB|nr:Stat5.1 [Thecamonas trahens ATCC 50062]KNC47249.1 Stat5.1 [Thecamonas trahens ATCC 50062]|eukprot:XP_013759592.1 Stat5.1 [Thecamonas trahens ATCC 50062]